MYYIFNVNHENLGDWTRRKKKLNAEKIAEKIQECYCYVHWFSKIFVKHAKGSVWLQKGSVSKEMNFIFQVGMTDMMSKAAGEFKFTIVE